ncbi:UNVERIFIED_ORG: hypothetical protein GGI63_005104 [Rhizobium esperanzae]|nr:hypothetical protein RHECNPAF_3970024 [Rhizobium etli CNPAF512]
MDGTENLFAETDRLRDAETWLARMQVPSKVFLRRRAFCGPRQSDSANERQPSHAPVVSGVLVSALASVSIPSGRSAISRNDMCLISGCRSGSSFQIGAVSAPSVARAGFKKNFSNDMACLAFSSGDVNGDPAPAGIAYATNLCAGSQIFN